MNPSGSTFLTDQTIISGVPNFLPVMAGIWAVAYFVFMRGGKKRSAYKSDDEGWL